MITITPTDFKSFVIISTIIFVILCLVWSQKNWTNLLIKVAFILMALFGVAILLSK